MMALDPAGFLVSTGSMQHMPGNPLLSFDDWYNATHEGGILELGFREIVFEQRRYSQYVADWINSNGMRKP